MYIKGQRNDLTVVMTNEQIDVKMNITEFMELTDNKFLEVHRSYAINTDYMSKLERYTVTMKNGEQLPVPVKKYNEIRDEMIKMHNSKKRTAKDKVYDAAAKADYTITNLDDVPDDKDFVTVIGSAEFADANTGVVTIKGTGETVTITATKAGDENFGGEQIATVTFMPIKKSVGFKVTNLNQIYDGGAKSVTVRRHNRSIYEKLEVASKDELMLYIDLLKRCKRQDKIRRNIKI